MIDTVKTAVMPPLTIDDVQRMPLSRVEEYIDDFRNDFKADLNRRLFVTPRGHLKTNALVAAATRRNAVFGYGRPAGPIPEVTGRHFTLQLQDDLMGDMLKSAYGKELVTLLSSEQPLYAAFANANRRDVGCISPGKVVETPPGMVSLRGVVVGPDGQLEPTLTYARKPGGTPAKDAFDRAWLDRTKGPRPAGGPLWDPDEGSTVMR